jgi:hypothetical protein
MARIAILDRGDMNAEQARVYDAAKQSSGIVGGPYYAYIRLPKLFDHRICTPALFKEKPSAVTGTSHFMRTFNGQYKKGDKP